LHTSPEQKRWQIVHFYQPHYRRQRETEIDVPTNTAPEACSTRVSYCCANTDTSSLPEAKANEVSPKYGKARIVTSTSYWAALAPLGADFALL
jgi:hypothetical protein